MKPDPEKNDKTTVEQLLTLVRASLWKIPANVVPFTDAPVHWDAIGHLAMLQTVGPLAVEGAMTLPPGLRPPKEWQLKGLAIVERNRRTHRLLDSSVAEAFSLLTGAGITPVLLKGQAYARAYPDPTLRQCGDIDIYVGEDSYRRAYEASRRFGWESDLRFTPSEKHYGCHLGDVKIELHRCSALFTSKKVHGLFTRWSTAQLTGGQRSITIGGESVNVPTPIFDVVFSFVHLFNHFIQKGVGLRQVCDWTMLLHTRASYIDRQELERLLKDFRLLRAWRIFTPLAVDILGLPPQECPLYAPQYRQKASMILSFIMREGNFGVGKRQPALKRPHNYFLGKAYSLVLGTSQLYSKLLIDPVTVMKHYAGFIRKGIKRVLSDMKS